MKKLLLALLLLALPATAFAAPVSWDGNVGTMILQPLQSLWTALVKADRFQATSTTKASTFPYASTTALSVSGLTSGNCVQASTGGLLVTAATPCGSGSGSSAYDFPLSGNATSTLTQFNGGLTAFASSTIGAGTQIGGLTVDGGATTTGTFAVTNAGSATLPAIGIYTGGLFEGIYANGAGVLGFTSNGTGFTWSGSASALYPNTDNVRDLGRTSNRWRVLNVTTASTTNLTTGLAQGLLFSGTNGVTGSTATSTIAFSGPFSGSGWGALVGGANSTVTWTGVSTTSPFAVNGFVYTNAAGLLVTAASSTLNLPNSALTNSTISGVALGSNLGALTNDTTLVGSSYNGSGAISDWGIDLANANTWTGKQTFTNASSTLFSTTYASSTQYFGAGLATCNSASSALTWSAGVFGCNSITGGSSVWPFVTTDTNFGVAVQSTTTPEWFKNGLFASSTSRFDTLMLGSSTPQAYTNAPLVITGNTNTHVQSVLGNLNAGSSASADYVVGADLQTNTRYYGDLGYNSSVNADASFTGFAANALYLYNSDGELDLATASTTNANAAIKFFTGGTLAAKERARITQAGYFGVGTTTPAWALQIASSTAPQLTLSDGANHWSMRSVSGALYFATSSASTFATSTISNLYIDKNGFVRAKDVTNQWEGVLSPTRDLGFAYATTSWTGTTTLRIGPSPAAITVRAVYCETNVGTVGVSLHDGTNRALYIPTASTTINKFLYTSSNNTFTAGESIQVDIGTPATSPTTLSCRFLYTYD